MVESYQEMRYHVHKKNKKITMIQLLIETAVERAFVGLASEGKIIECIYLPEGLQSSKYLFPHLSDLLNKHGLTPRDLGLIGCGIGPGFSYTGIRVGAAIAQSMAYALRLPLVGLCSLKSYMPSRPGPFAVVYDAKIGGIYLIKGNFDGKEVGFEEMPKMVKDEEMIEPLQDAKVLVTPHLVQLQSKIGRFLPSMEWEEAAPSGEIFAKQVDENYKKNIFSKKAELNLLYLRKTQAEIEKTLGIKGNIG